MSGYTWDCSVVGAFQVGRVVLKVQRAINCIGAEIERQRKARIEAAFLACLQRDADERIAKLRTLFGLKARES